MEPSSPWGPRPESVLGLKDDIPEGKDPFRLRLISKYMKIIRMVAKRATQVNPMYLVAPVSDVSEECDSSTAPLTPTAEQVDSTGLQSHDSAS